MQQESIDSIRRILEAEMNDELLQTLETLLAVAKRQATKDDIIKIIEDTYALAQMVSLGLIVPVLNSNTQTKE